MDFGDDSLEPYSLSSAAQDSVAISVDPNISVATPQISNDANRAAHRSAEEPRRRVAARRNGTIARTQHSPALYLSHVVPVYSPPEDVGGGSIAVLFVMTLVIVRRVGAIIHSEVHESVGLLYTDEQEGASHFEVLYEIQRL